MLFRPEEVHARSPVGSIVCGTADLAVGVADNRFRLGGE